MYTVTYTHRRPNLTTPFFADDEPAFTARLAAKVKQANGFVSQTSVMSADGLANIVTVVWQDKGSADQFNKRKVATHYRREREGYDLEVGTTTEIK